MHALRPTISDSTISIHTRVWFFISIPPCCNFFLNIPNTDSWRRLLGVLGGVVDGLAAFRYVRARARNSVAAREKSGTGDHIQNDESHHDVLLRKVLVAGSGCGPDTFLLKLERQEQADSRCRLRCIDKRRCFVALVAIARIAISVAIAVMIVMPVCLAWSAVALGMLLAAMMILLRLQWRCRDEAGDRYREA
jgi:hypothetical protein